MGGGFLGAVVGMKRPFDQGSTSDHPIQNADLPEIRMISCCLERDAEKEERMAPSCEDSHNSNRVV